MAEQEHALPRSEAKGYDLGCCDVTECGSVIAIVSACNNGVQSP